MKIDRKFWQNLIFPQHGTYMVTKQEPMMKAVDTILIIHWLLLSTYIFLNDFISAEIIPDTYRYN